jgi:hypothetical protein
MTCNTLFRTFGSLALVTSLGGCARQDVDSRVASLGVPRAPADERGTRPREAPAGTGSMPEVPLNVPIEEEPPMSLVLWTPQPSPPAGPE